MLQQLNLLSNPRARTLMLNLLLLVCSSRNFQVNAGGFSGLGESYLLTHDTSDTHETNDLAFKPKAELAPETETKFIKLVKSIQVDLVAPNKRLRDVMNTISTKTRALFLQDYDHYYKDLGIGSTSRPMLLTYLGLELLNKDQVQSWYEPQRGRVQSQILAACASLMDQHEAAIDEVELISDLPTDNKPYLAYLVQRNNLNLFMLENYILLCSKIEPEQYATKISGQNLLII